MSINVILCRAEKHPEEPDFQPTQRRGWEIARQGFRLGSKKVLIRRVIQPGNVIEELRTEFHPCPTAGPVMRCFGMQNTLKRQNRPSQSWSDAVLEFGREGEVRLRPDALQR